MTIRNTVFDFLSNKGKRKWKQIHVDSAKEAAAANEAGIEILSCDPGAVLRAARAAAPNALISAGIAGKVSSPSQAIRGGFDTLEDGADTVYCSQSPHFIEAMAQEGIPVTGHVGLVPDLATWTNFRAIGKTPDEAIKVMRKVRELENAGCATIEVEVVPVELAAYITRNTHMITMGMGCGDVCDTQYLFSCDVLGTNIGHYPRHAKKYTNLAALEAELQVKRVEAFREFAKDVEDGTYPEQKHEVHMREAEFQEFLSRADKE